MKKWVAKAIVQKVISWMPFSQRINFFFQKYVTKGVRLSDAYFEDRLKHAGEHIKNFKTNNSEGKNFPLITLELGTGWYPVVPLCLFLVGSNEIYSIDINKLTNRKRLIECINKFVQYSEQKKLDAFFTILPERLEKLSYIAAHEKDIPDENKLLKELGLNYLVGDARKLSLPDQYFDLIHSNNTFEHIYPTVLSEIVKQFSRAQKPGGIMSHFIDMSDHFAHNDKSISVYHFLRFSEKKWKWIDNSVQPQNRMRVSEYETLYRSLNIPYQITAIRAGDTETLEQMKIDQRFSVYPVEIWAVTHCTFVSKKI